MLTLTNQTFCYWLQGYFEIAKQASLTKEKVLLIQGSLKKINEPLGYFTSWLSEVLDFFASQDYRQALLDYFYPEIYQRLNSIFHHVIDNSYDTDISREDSQKIHDGVL